MAVNNLDLDVKFWDLGPGWRLYPTQPLILDLYRQKYAKNRSMFSVFQKLWPFKSAHVRAFAIFSPTPKSNHWGRFRHKYSLPALQPGFMAHFRIFSNNQIGETHDNLNK